MIWSSAIGIHPDRTDVLIEAKEEARIAGEKNTTEHVWIPILSLSSRTDNDPARKHDNDFAIG